MENVRKRLKAMCKGTLDVSSAPGKGTTAIISIPKTMPLADGEEKKNNENSGGR